MQGDIDDCPVGDENAGVADLELPKDTARPKGRPLESS